MWKRNLFLILIIFLTFACSADDDDEDDFLSNDGDFQILIGDADNLGLGGISGSSSSKYLQASVASDPDLFTVDASGDIAFLQVQDGENKTIRKLNKVWKHDKNSKVKGAFLVSDSETETSDWYLVDKNDKAHKLKKRPQKGAKWGNAPLFWEREKLYFLDTRDDLIELDISTDVSQDIYQVFRSGVKQAVMATGGDWMLEMSSGKILHWEPLTDLDTTMDDNVPSESDDAEVRKYFIPHKDGFLFHGEVEGYFFRALLGAGGLSVTPAYENDGDNVIMYVAGELCEYQAVGEEELMFCGNRWIYQLGNDDEDMREINFIWTGHTAALSPDHTKTVSSANYVYHWTQESDIISGLTRIDLNNDTCSHLFFRDGASTACADPFMTQLYSIEHMTVSDDDTVRFCGRRLGETQLKLVEIKDAAGTPEVNEQDIEKCSQLIVL